MAEAPIALGLSGGGDSVALLLLAADWAKARGRRLLALTVDHQLNPESGNWTRFAGEVARTVGADWQALTWHEAKGGTGVTARARAARHGLMAKAAREAGASVLMLAHTRGDIAEGEVMRAEGSTLGQLRDWSPSPVWPEGREVMLFRPLLEEGREDLRDFLRARGQGWIEDPANVDPRYGRSRARAHLAGREIAASVPMMPGLGGLDLGSGVWAGVFELPRQVSGQVLAIALVCAGGGEQLPRGSRLEAILTRLKTGEDFVATLVGARLEAEGASLRLMREPGEFRRKVQAPLALEAGRAQVWDGRFEIRMDEPHWQVEAAEGCLGRLEPLERQRIFGLPSAARLGLPILRNILTDQVFLAHSKGRVRALGGARLTASLGEWTQESELFDAIHSVTAVSILFSVKDCDRQALGAG